MKKNLIRVGLILMLVATTSVAATGDRWLHVRVVDHGSSGGNVNVNVPLQFVESLLPAIQMDELHDGKLWLDSAEFEGIDLPQVLRALQDAPDAEFVTIKADDGSVKVSKEAGFLIVVAEERNDRVQVKMPMAVVDALVGSDPGTLDVAAALRVLATYEGEDLVTVESDDTSVRVWIDSNETGE